MKSFLFLPVIILLLLLMVLKLLGQQKPASLDARMDSIFQQYKEAAIPGCAVSVIRDGKTVYQKGFGMANLEYDIPVTPATVFDVASLSKQFTGYAIAVLEHEGKLSMDDDVRRYVPEMPEFGKPVTIGHLVHHTSGLRDWPQVLKAAGWREDEVFTLKDVLQMLQYQKELDFEPGAKYAYSNTNYNLLAVIVEKVSGQSFPAWMDAHVFKPLQMQSSFFLSDYRTVIKNAAHAYTLRDSVYVKEPGIVTAYGSNSLITSVADMSKWLIHFEKALEAKDPVYTRMLTDGLLNNGEKVHYGYGVATGAYRGVPMIMHTGRWGSFQTYSAIFPDAHLSLVLFSNAGNFTRDRYIAAITALFMNDRLTPVEKAAANTAKPSYQLDTTLAMKYAGTYQLGPGWAVTYTVEKGRLMAQENGDEKFPLEPKEGSTFWGEAFKSYITFMQDSASGFNMVKHKSIQARRITPWKPDSAHLNAYTGEYYSPELETAYRIDTARGQLILHHMRLGDTPLRPDPVIAERFTSIAGEISFVKEEGAVTALLLSGNRVKQIRFDKR